VTDGSGWIRVGDAAAWTRGRGRRVEVEGVPVAIFRDRAGWLALDDTCPHMGASLSGGYVEDGIVTCPWHAWRFRLSDGAWADNPRIKIGCYPVRVEGDDVLIAVHGEPGGRAQ